MRSGRLPTAPQAGAAPKAAKREGRMDWWGGLLVEGLFEGLFASELGFMVFGGVALAVGLPLLVVFAGAAWAARLRRKREPHTPDVGLGALLTPVVLLVVFLVLSVFGILSYAAFRTGHPAVMACSYAAALATLGFVGFTARQRWADRRPRDRPPSVKLKTR